MLYCLGYDQAGDNPWLRVADVLLKPCIASVSLNNGGGGELLWLFGGWRK